MTAKHCLKHWDNYMTQLGVSNILQNICHSIGRAWWYELQASRPIDTHKCVRQRHHPASFLQTKPKFNQYLEKRQCCGSPIGLAPEFLKFPKTVPGLDPYLTVQEVRTSQNRTSCWYKKIVRYNTFSRWKKSEMDPGFTTEINRSDHDPRKIFHKET